MQSPWLKDFVQTASSKPLPLLPGYLAEFPSRWPFPRGDLYHWIPLLNRFDSILESFCSTYKLSDGPQLREFRWDVLLASDPDPSDTQAWSVSRLRSLGYQEDGDRLLIEVVLRFTRMLLEHCGNRSIYASSAHLNDLLNTTSLTVLLATLEVGAELARRYQASVKRIGSASRQASTALLANHYNIDLDRVQQVAGAFLKTPIIALSESMPIHASSSSAKGKERSQSIGQKNVASMYANDLVAVASADDARWQGWGDVKLSYYPAAAQDVPKAATSDRTPAASPNTPTPLRRSSTSSQQQTPTRSGRHSLDDSSPSSVRNHGSSHDKSPTSHPKTLDITQTTLSSTSIYELLSRCPADMPKASQYEYLNRLRVAKALLGSTETRQRALAIRLLAITNLAYIYPESVFVEKVLRHDIDETRRFQLVYQLADLIRPSSDGSSPVPLPIQTISIRLLEAVSSFATRYPDVLSALNANVSHGVLLYIIRKAVASMKVDDTSDDGLQSTEYDEWHHSLFSLALHMATSSPSRIGSEMTSSGLVEILVEILNVRSKKAQRSYANAISNIDSLIWQVQSAFQTFFNANGLDAMAQLVVTSVNEASDLAQSGHGTKPESRSQVVDYEIPFYQQQTLKWLLKFLHHVLSNSYSYGTNTDRLLRNLVDKSELLTSLRDIVERMQKFGSVVWTNAVTILSDFINNDPTSFAAISESGMIKSYLETVTGRPVPDEPQSESKSTGAENAEVGTPESSEASIIFEADNRPHPPTAEILAEPRNALLAGGILPSTEAIHVVPQVLNAISLNNTGMKMVVASKAFDSFFEIFESPAHVQCMDTDGELAAAVGNSFDELARHHPSLRTAISNAVIDMVARVAYLGKTKAKTAGWGAKLVLENAEGKAITADETLLVRISEQTSTTKKGKGKARDDDPDVEMADASLEASNTETSSTATNISRNVTSYNSITPYIFALSNFLTAYISNMTLKSSFVERGGIELLLDLCESPSLPYDFSDSGASRTLQHVISQLVDNSPILGLPSLLNRTQAAVDALRPLSDGVESYPLFAPFLLLDVSLTREDVDNWDAQMTEQITTGTAMVKALLNTQSFLKTLSQCFPTSQRSNTVQLSPINVFDQYIRLVKALGPLLRSVLAEESAEENIVPQHWSPRRPAIGRTVEGSTGISDGGRSDPEGDESSLPETVTDTTTTRPVDEPSSDGQPKRPTKQEQASVRYQNYETLRVLLHSMMPTAFPFFQTLGKALLPKRDRDAYSRPYHLEIAKTLVESVLSQLQPSLALSEPKSKDLHFWIIMLHTIHEMLIDSKSTLLLTIL